MGKTFDSPLYVPGGVGDEPKRYLAEEPYELSKSEFNILKKGKFRADVWFPLTCGATLGIALSVIGKALNALIDKQTPSLEKWEIWAIVAGLILAAAFKIIKKESPEEREFDEIKVYIDQYFITTPRRRVHVTKKEEENK